MPRCGATFSSFSPTHRGDLFENGWSACGFLGGIAPGKTKVLRRKQATVAFASMVGGHDFRPHDVETRASPKDPEGFRAPTLFQTASVRNGVTIDAETTIYLIHPYPACEIKCKQTFSQLGASSRVQSKTEPAQI
jgi:hypothetical protein